MNAKEITVYQCSECDAAYKTIESANLCCQPSLCACGATISKTQWRCDTCKSQDDRLKWECAERGALHKDGWLCSDGEYFQEPEDFIEGLDIEEEEFDELMALPLPEFAREYQVYLCKPHKPTPINLHEHYEDFCFEDDELPGNWQQAENEVNDWIYSVPDNEWPQVSSVVAWNGEVAR